MTIKTRTLALVVVAVVAGSIVTARAAGWWITESSRIPITIRDGEFAGEADPADIRGSYALADIEAAFGIDSAILAGAFGLDAESDAVRLRDLEELYGELTPFEIGTDAMRLFVARYRGLPYEPEETTGLPAQAVEILLSLDTIDSDEAARLSAREVVLPASAAQTDSAPATESAPPTASAAAAPAENPASAGAPEDHAEDSEFLVNGNTTFGELLSWGVTREAVEAVIGAEMGARPATVRDWAAESGRQFGALRPGLQAAVDARDGSQE